MSYPVTSALPDTVLYEIFVTLYPLWFQDFTEKCPHEQLMKSKLVLQAGI
jgi:hypothetical protein